MGDLHERLTAAVNARLELARAFKSTTWRLEAGCVIVASDGANAEQCAEAHWVGVGEHIAANDPATVIRHCQRDLKVLQRHSPIGRTGGWCDHCYDAETGDMPWPCDDVRDLAAAYGIEVTA